MFGIHVIFQTIPEVKNTLLQWIIRYKKSIFLIVVSHQVTPILEGIPTIIPSLNNTRVPDIFNPR
jgi:hypothetical protein